MSTTFEGRVRGRVSPRKLLAASLCAAIIALPALAQPASAEDVVQEGRTIEAFIGTNLIGLDGYPANRSVKVEVVRNGVVVGSKTMTTDGTGFLEINHVGGADCFDPPATPDIMPGDTIRTTTEGDAEGVTDRAVVRDVGIGFEDPGIVVDENAGTITVSGHARALENASLVPGSDVLELRLNKGNADNRWDVFPGGDQDRANRRDLRVDIGGQVGPDGNWTRTLNVGSEDAGDWLATPGEVSLEWSAPPGVDEEVNPPAIFVADEGEGGIPGCPPLAEYAMTDTSHPFVNLDNQGNDITLGGVAFGAAGVQVSVPGGAQHDATLTPANPAEPDGPQTWTASIPASEVAALPQGQFLASASFSGPGAPTQPSTIKMVKDTETPATPTATPPAGSYNVRQAVTLDSEDGAAIHYTVNGAEPTAASRKFERQILITASQTVRAAAIDAAGNRSEIASFPYVIREASSLTLNASRAPINFGQTTALSGRLISDGAALADKRVILERRPAGTTGFSRVPGQPAAGLITNDNGAFRLAGVKPAKNTDYRARFVTDAGFKGSASTLERVGVRAAVSNVTSTAQIRVNQVKAISGTVSPAHTGNVRVIIKRGTTTVVSRNVTLTNSRYSTSYRPTLAGTYSVSVRFAGDADHLAGTSPVRSFRVIR